MFLKGAEKKSMLESKVSELCKKEKPRKKMGSTISRVTSLQYCMTMKIYRKFKMESNNQYYRNSLFSRRHNVRPDLDER